MRVPLYIAGSVALLGLFGCSHSGWNEPRAQWRRDAEIACFKAAVVKEGPGIIQLRPINGPGMCGADFPLKVSALGTLGALGFADDPRPPSGVPQYSPIPAPRAPATVPAADPRAPYEPPYDPPGQTRGTPAGPMAIHPQGLDPTETEGEEPADMAAPNGPAPQGPYAQPREPEPLPPLGPQRGPNPAGNAVAVAPAATLACPMVSAVDRWIATAVQPAAQRWFGQPVVQIHQISAYACRGMNGNPNAHISEHAFGNALDVEGFILADGRKVTVQHGWKGAPDERGFLHDVHAAACQQFTTVLGPGANIYHYNHLHLDLMRHARGRSVCNPAPIPGDLISSRPGGPLTTGSIVGSRAHVLGYAPERAQDASLPAAIAGED